jgi:hypothetical protein
VQSDTISDKRIYTAKKLLAVGVFTNKDLINAETCKEKGIVVFNGKSSNVIVDNLLKFINTGDTSGAKSFPKIHLPAYENTHRFLHIHQNVPGVMATINSVLAASKRNITAQYLSTDAKVGYVMTDIDKEYNKDLIEKLKKIEGTIKFRVLY